MIERIHGTGSKLVVISVESCIPVHTYWAILLDAGSMSSRTACNLGLGTHSDQKVAAARAITEAVQSRLGMIHGAREDLPAKSVFRVNAAQRDKAYRVFSGLKPDTSWDQVSGRGGTATGDLLLDYDDILDKLARTEQRAIRFDLTKADIGVPVTKVITPGLRFNHALH
jgi:ribosomal protein S12 methylthiotransferase accessory factor